MLPYETYFYSSGAVEDKWKPSDISLNRVIVIVGFVLGSALCVALIMIGAQYFGPRHIEPQLPGIVADSAAVQFGVAGLLVAIAGMFFAFAGAAIETALTSAYNIAQFFGWPWGKFRRPRDAARFTLAWIAAFAVAAVIVLTGVDPVSVVEYSIVFSVVILPLTYLPLLLVAGDERLMGAHANGRLANVLGWSYMGVTTVAAVSAIPLLILTHGGQG
jgi:Mn2+/Fe2+ NRAMP family transporter